MLARGKPDTKEYILNDLTYITSKLMSLSPGDGGQMLATSGYLWDGPGREDPRCWSVWILVILCGCVGSLCKHLSYFVHNYSTIFLQDMCSLHGPEAAWEAGQEGQPLPVQGHSSW